MPLSSMPNQEDGPIKSIAADADFKMYLDAVVSASQRSRATLYVLLVGMIAIYAAYRNNVHPDWVSSRIKQLKIAYENYDAPASYLVSKKEVDQAKKYAEGELRRPPLWFEDLYNQSFSPPPIATTNPTPASSGVQIALAAPIPTNPTAERESLKLRFETLTKLRAEASTLQMPIINLKFDTNDGGLIEGMILSLILYVLAACLRRESINLELATASAIRNKNPDNLELLLMAQVLSPAPKYKQGGKSNKFRFSIAALYVFVVLPVILHFFVCLNDFRTYRIRETLESPVWSVVDTVFEWGFLVTLVTLSMLCCRDLRRLNKAFGNLESEKINLSKA